MGKSIIQSLRLILKIVLLVTIYSASYLCLTDLAGSNTAKHVTGEANCEFHDNLLINIASIKNYLSNLYRPKPPYNFNIYFTVKTTPRNYVKRILPSQISWFQKVDKDLVSIRSYIAIIASYCYRYMLFLNSDCILACKHAKPKQLLSCVTIAIAIVTMGWENPLKTCTGCLIGMFTLN